MTCYEDNKDAFKELTKLTNLDPIQVNCGIQHISNALIVIYKSPFSQNYVSCMVYQRHVARQTT